MTKTLNSPNDYSRSYQVNPIYARHSEPPRLKGRYHNTGTCGYMGSLCSTCHDMQVAWHLRIAEDIAKEYPPAANESYVEYWRRVGGRMLDTWPEAASHALFVYQFVAR